MLLTVFLGACAGMAGGADAEKEGTASKTTGTPATSKTGETVNRQDTAAGGIRFHNDARKAEKKIEAVIQRFPDTEAKADNGDIRLLSRVVKVWKDTEKTEEYPNLERLYVSGSDDGDENRKHAEKWIFEWCQMDGFQAADCYSQVFPRKVTNQEGGVREIVFEIDLEEHIPISGVDVVLKYVLTGLADIVDTEDGPRLLYCFFSDAGPKQPETGKKIYMPGVEGEIRGRDLELLASFAKACEDTLTFGRYPVFSNLYDTENPDGIKAMRLTEAAVYEKSLSHGGKTVECFSELEILEGNRKEENRRELSFMLRQEVRGAGTEAAGIGETGCRGRADITDTLYGPRLIGTQWDHKALNILEEEIKESGIDLLGENAGEELEKWVKEKWREMESAPERDQN